MNGSCDSAGHTCDLRPQGAGRSWRRWTHEGRRAAAGARPERPGHAWPITSRLAGARVWPRRPATSPRVPRSRADPSVWPGRELRRTAGRCPATAAPRPWRRLCLLRQRGDELVDGVGQFLFVDDGVAVEDRPPFVPGQEHGGPLGHAGADQGAGGGAAVIVEEAGRHASRLTGGAPRRAPVADGDAVAVEDERAIGVAACPPSVQRVGGSPNKRVLSRC